MQPRACRLWSHLVVALRLSRVLLAKQSCNTLHQHTYLRLVEYEVKSELGRRQRSFH